MSHFKSNVKCDMLSNNLCKSSNSSILLARDIPIMILLEKIRFWQMCKFATKRHSVENWIHPVSHRVMAQIEKYKNVARYYQSTIAGNAKF